MFKSNVTQTYNFQDASQEIIIMLLGAFLLGCLLMWLLNKLFNKDYNNTYRYDSTGKDETNKLKQTATLQAQTTGDVKIIDASNNSISKTIPPADDLTKIGGVDQSMVKKLKGQGITSFTQLRDIKNRDLKAIQHGQSKNKREIETWPHQASLAAKGDWQKLTDYQAFIKRAQIASSNTQSKKPANADDLSVVEGINPEMERILYNKGIYTFKQLSETDSTLLKKHLDDESSNFNKTETESWPHQAAMAEKGQWDELKIYQEFMHADTDEVTSNNLTKEKPVVATPTVTLDQTAKKNLSDHDKLKKIEGIGPKIEEVLNNGGIYTYSQLQNSDTKSLRKLLDDAGKQFKRHDPKSWPQQAKLANNAAWDDLKSYQQSLTKEPKQISTKKKKTKQQKKQANDKLNTRSTKDDLKKIEGIGPKIQELLNNAGIYSFQELADNSRDYIKNLLDEAGPQFRMHEPESWPHQAKLAANGEWEELEKYQDYLISGRE